MIFRVLFLSLILLACTGCDVWKNLYGEKPIPKPEMEINSDSEGSACTVNIEDLKARFSDATLHVNEIVSVVDCADAMLSRLSQRIRTKTEGSISAREIQTLINSHILGNFEIKPAWIDSLFLTKDILLGGNQAQSLKIGSVRELLNKIKKKRYDIVKLSKYLSTLDHADHEDPVYPRTQKKVFSLGWSLIRTLLEDQDGKLTRSIYRNDILQQLAMLGDTQKDVGIHYIKAAFLANRILRGKSEKVMKGTDLDTIAKHVERVYDYIVHIHYFLDKEESTPEDTLKLITLFQNLIDYLLRLFLESPAAGVTRPDFQSFMELMHGNQGSGDIIVDAIMSLKQQLFGGDKRAILPQEVSDILDILKLSLISYRITADIAPEKEAGITLQKLETWFSSVKPTLSDDEKDSFEKKLQDFPNSLYYWTVSFELTSEINKDNYFLTQIAFSFIEPIIEKFDKNNDGQLRYESNDTSKNELTYKDLLGMIQTTQKAIVGADVLTGAEPIIQKTGDEVVSNPLSISDDVLGKAIMSASDIFLLNSNVNQQLDKYEILDITSFVIENNLTTGKFLRDFNRSKDLVDQLVASPLLQEQFPAFDQYDKLGDVIERFIDPQTNSISDGGLEALLALIRFVEISFLKYDTDSNGTLNEEEMDAMYETLWPVLSELLHPRPTEISDSYSLLRTTSSPFMRLLSTLSDNLIDLDRQYKKAFRSMLINGEIPENELRILMTIPHGEATRASFMRLANNALQLF